MRFRKTSIALVGIVLALAGCSTSHQAITVGEAGKSTASAAPVESESHRTLTQAQIQEVLPTAAQVGDGWVVDDSTPADSTSTSTSETFNPAECDLSPLSAQDVAPEALEPHTKPENESKVSFKLPGEGVFDMTEATVSITSYKDDVPTSLLKKLAAKLKKCANFTMTDDSTGVTTTMQILPLSLPNHGDETLAFRLQANAGMILIIADHAEIIVGHNLISVTEIGLGKIDTGLVGRVANATVANLNRVTGTD